LRIFEIRLHELNTYSVLSVLGQLVISKNKIKSRQ